MAWALRTELTLDEVNLHLAALEDAGLLGAAEEDGRATVYLPDRVEGLPLDGEWVELADRDWNEEWKAGLEPVRVGDLVVRAPWHERQPGIDVVIDPGQAFGTGHHETTTGCLSALRDLDLHGRRVLDVGTGTGVLAIAASLLGAAQVVAVDSDPLAVAAARDNARRNAVGLTVTQGSVEDAGGVFDVVVANLDTATLARLAEGLAGRLAPGGVLVASGVSVERCPEAVVTLRRAGLRPSVRTGLEWAVLTATRERGISSRRLDV